MVTNPWINRITVLVVMFAIYWTFVTASKYAGSFYQAMGNAGLAADPNNKRRILAAFPEMVATYGTASRLHQTMRAGVAA
jgi:hypothetical protein